MVTTMISLMSTFKPNRKIKNHYYSLDILKTILNQKDELKKKTLEHICLDTLSTSEEDLKRVGNFTLEPDLGGKKLTDYEKLQTDTVNKLTLI